LFSCYYRSSFAARNVCDHEWIGRNWNNKLWRIREKKGRTFSDHAMFFTYKRWNEPIQASGQESFDAFFGFRFTRGLLVVDNAGHDLADIDQILATTNH